MKSKFVSLIYITLFLLSLPFCGSGSSGFDRSAVEGAIDTTESGGGCIEAVEEFTICSPATEPLPPLETSEQTMRVSPSSGSTVVCENPGEDACSFEVFMIPYNFPEGTSFLGTFGRDEEGSLWTLNQDPFSPASEETTEMISTFTLTSELSQPRTPLRIAVLVYYPGDLVRPSSPGTTEMALEDFGSSLAFVVSGLTVENSDE